MSDQDKPEMDEVLASIRQIVDTGQGRRAAAPSAGSATDDDDSEPLILTPEMRIDSVASPPPDADTEDRAQPAPVVAMETAAASPDDAPAVAEEPPAMPALDTAAVEEIVRRVIREELQGELGATLSDNVRALIASEIARAKNQT